MFWSTFSERMLFGALKSVSIKMPFQFLTTLIAKASFSITADASSLSVREAKHLSLRESAQSYSSLLLFLCFFF